MPLKQGDLAILGKIERESRSTSQNKETHYLWGRVDRYGIGKLFYFVKTFHEENSIKIWKSAYF